MPAVKERQYTTRQITLFAELCGAVIRQKIKFLPSYVVSRGVPNILRQPAEAEYSAVWPNIRQFGRIFCRSRIEGLFLRNSTIRQENLNYS